MPFSAQDHIDKIVTAINKLTAISITNTKPYFIYNTDSSKDTSDFGNSVVAIEAVEDTTFTSLTTNMEGSTGKITGQSITMKAGARWFMHIKELELATGSVILYRMNN